MVVPFQGGRTIVVVEGRTAITTTVVVVEVLEHLASCNKVYVPQLYIYRLFKLSIHVS